MAPQSTRLGPPVRLVALGPEGLDRREVALDFPSEIRRSLVGHAARMRSVAHAALTYGSPATRNQLSTVVEPRG